MGSPSVAAQAPWHAPRLPVATCTFISGAIMFKKASGSMAWDRRLYNQRAGHGHAPVKARLLSTGASGAPLLGL
eukprot:6213588-Pleurochrysis_carterae.AAC.4